MYRKIFKRISSLIILVFISMTAYLFLDNPYVAPRANAEDRQEVRGGRVTVGDSYLSMSVVSDKVTQKFTTDETNRQVIKTFRFFPRFETSSGLGADMYMSTHTGPDLIMNAGDQVYKIASIEQPMLMTVSQGIEKLPVNHWAISSSYTDNNGKQQLPGYMPLPKLGEMRKVSELNRYDKSRSFTVDAYVKVSNTIPAGEYSTTLDFTAISRYEPNSAVFMRGQEFSRLLKSKIENLNSQDRPTIFKRSNVKPASTEQVFACQNTDSAISLQPSISDVAIDCWIDKANKTLFWYSEATSVNFWELEYLFWGLGSFNEIDLSGVDKLVFYGGPKQWLDGVGRGGNGPAKIIWPAKVIFKGDSMEDFFKGARVRDISFANFTFEKPLKSFKGMFRSASARNINLTGIDLSQIINMDEMFNGYGGTDDDLRGILSQLNTGNVTSMNGMFYYCSNYKIDLSNFDTRKVTDMSNMFYYTSRLKDLNLSSFDTSKVTNMSGMFQYAGWYGAGLNLDISSFNTRQVTNFDKMFNVMSKTKTIYVGENFIVNSGASTTDMLKGNFQLIGGAGTAYDVNHVDGEYARIDNPAAGKPGYFTVKTP